MATAIRILCADQVRGRRIHSTGTTEGFSIRTRFGSRGLKKEPRQSHWATWMGMAISISFVRITSFGLMCDPGGVVDNNTAYLNTGGQLDSLSLPFWENDKFSFSPEGNVASQSVALGDVTGDGRLDVFFGNRDAQGTPFPNSGYWDLAVSGSRSPDWQSRADGTQEVALGDMDGDGDLDLVCGRGLLTIYLNNGGVLSTTPDFDEAQDGAPHLGDADGDGDLDIFLVRENTPLLVNDGGTPTAHLSWSPQVLGRFTDLALGDVDGDGDLDVVFAHQDNSLPLTGDKNTLFLGRKNPPFRRSAVNPTRHLPNNGGFVRRVTLEQTDPNTLRVTIRAIDVESDPIWIVPEYQFEGEPTWFLAKVAGQTGKIGPFTASPAGTDHAFDWDIFEVPFDRRDVNLRITVIEDPKRVSLIQHAASFLKPVGRVSPLRPEIALAATALPFSTVTVGDTTCLSLEILNRGTDALTVSIQLPSAEMSVSSQSLTIAPGTSDTVAVCVRPRNELSISGDVRIAHTDPLAPDLVIPVTTDIRSLAVSHQVFPPAQQVPLGEAIIVIITPAPQVRVEGGFLFHRPIGSGAFGDSIRILVSGSNFVAIIPGDAVTEAGLEYYIRVENSGLFATDPVGAPAVFHTQQVEAPSVIVADPRPTAGTAFLENREIEVLVSLLEGTNFVRGALHYRLGGESSYQVDSLEASGLLPTATIPDSAVGPRGIEFWVEVETETRILTDPASRPAQDPRTIQVTVQNLVEDDQHSGGAYRMVSVPLQFDPTFQGTIEALLSDQKAFGSYDPFQWRSFRYDPARARYVELSEPGEEDWFRPTPGKAWWLISKDTNRIETAPIVGMSTPTDEPYDIVLKPGLNQIGNPFLFAVHWDSVRVDTFMIADVDSVEAPQRWTGTYEPATVLEPFEGYWVRNWGGTDITLRIPPQEMVAAPATPEPLLADGDDDGWRIRITAEAQDARDSFNYIGAAAGAFAKRDRYDRSEVPMPPGRAISLYFPHDDWERFSGRYTVDIRDEMTSDAAAWGHAWRFDVAKNFSDETAGDDVSLEFSGVDDVPADVRVVLIDHALDRRVDLREASGYSFYATQRRVVTEEQTRFELLVGSDTFIETHGLPALPSETVLYQNHPNPFNPTTIIRYEIAEPGAVSLRIYDVTGALVKTLYNGPRQPGRYEVGWNGDNERGERVASGIYFYRLHTPQRTQTRKMVLLK